MTNGTVTQKTKYHCIASEHEGPMQADELRVFYGQLWCADCWHAHSKAGKRWDDLDRFADVQVAEQQPAAWARMTGGKVADAFADRALAEFVAGFAVHKLVPLYLHPQPAPDAALVEEFDAGRRAAQSEADGLAAPAVQGEPEGVRSLLVECERALCCPDPAQRQVTASKILRMLAASTAPAVQGEPVGLSRFIEMIEARASIRKSGMIDGITLLRDLRAMLAATPSAPQPTPCQECGGDGAGGEHEDDCAMAQHAEQQPSPHPDDAAVDLFAAAMKAKLTRKRQEGRGGWQSMTSEQLSALLHEHVRKGDPVDVGNLAMMLHQNGQGIEQKPAPDVTQLVEALGRALDFIRGDGDFEHREALERCECYACVTGEIIDSLAAYRKQEGES